MVQVLRDVIVIGIEIGILDKNKIYILTAGDPIGISGSTNIIRLIRKIDGVFFKNFNET